MSFNQSLWGGAGGQVAYDGNEHTKAQTNLLNAQAGEVPSKIEHQSAMADLERAQAEEIRAKRKDAQDLEAVMKDMQQPETTPKGDAIPTNPKTMAEMFDKRASIAMGAGKGLLGAKLAEEARRIRESDAKVQEQQSLAEKHRLEAQGIATAQVADYFAAIDPAKPETWNAARLAWVDDNPGKPIPKVLDRFDPDLIRNVQARSKASAEQAKERSKVFEDGLKTTREDRLERQRDEDLKIKRMDLERKKERDGVLAKNGGKNAPMIKEPSKALVARADAMIKEEFPGLPGDVTLGKDNLVNQGVYDTASRAMEIQRESQNTMTPNEALYKAFDEAKEAGLFKSEAEAPKKVLGINIPGTGGTKKSSYGRAPEEAAKPLPSNPSQLETGKTYTNKAGVEGVWNGKEMVLKAKKRAKARPAPVASRGMTTDDTGEEE